MQHIFVYECISAGGLGAQVPSSLQREGWAMLAALAADFQRVPGVEVQTLLHNDLPADLGPHCTRTSCEEEPTRFQELAAQCDATLVIAPEFDDLLLKRSQAILAVGGCLLGSYPDAIRLTADKWATALHWHSANVPHPRTVLGEAAADIAAPCVLKPRFGAGSQATFLIREECDRNERYAAARREWPQGELLLQEYVPGAAASVALLIGPQQVVPLLPACQHLSDDGRFRYLGGALPLPVSLAGRAQRLAQAAVAGIAGLQGYVGVDLVLGLKDDGSADYAIEINPRLTTSYLGLRQLCRHNLAELMLKCADGAAIDPPAWLPGEIHFSVADGPITRSCSAE